MMAVKALIKPLDYQKESEKHFVSMITTTKYC